MLWWNVSLINDCIEWMMFSFQFLTLSKKNNPQWCNHKSKWIVKLLFEFIYESAIQLASWTEIAPHSQGWFILSFFSCLIYNEAANYFKIIHIIHNYHCEFAHQAFHLENDCLKLNDGVFKISFCGNSARVIYHCSLDIFHYMINASVTSCH